MGFVAEVVPREDLMNCANRWAGEILECGPLSVRASKQAAILGLNQSSLEDAMASERDMSAIKTLMSSEDFREGPRAFAEKRTPEWKGR